MKTVLLPTDFSENAKAAVDYAISMYKDEHCYFILLNTYERPRTGQSMLKSIIEILRNDSKRGLKKEYKRLKEKFDIENVDIELMSENGILINVINSYINNRKIDMIFVGSKGESNFEEIIIGSNTAKVIRNIDFPTMIIPTQTEYKNIKKITFASDLKEITNEDVINPILSIAKKYDAEIDIVYIDKEKEDIDFNKAEEYLKKYLEGIKHSFHYIKDQDIPNGLMKYLESNPVDFITLIKRKGTLIDSIFHQSLTKKMALSAKYPLMVLHDIKK